MNGIDLAYLAASPAFLAPMVWKRWRHGKYRRSLPGMFGANLPEPPLAEGPRVWLHSVSVGETIAAGAVFRVLREHRPEWDYLSTTTTETGQDQAKRSLSEAQYHDFAPIDFSWKVRRFLHAYRPSAYLFFETEIWPNILRECGRRRMPAFLVNGKLSERSARGYAKIGFALRGPLSNVRAFLMQTEPDAERLARVIGRERAILVTGNVKFDNLPAPLSGDERVAMRAQFGIAADELLLMAGSTHPGEEKAVYTAFAALRNGAAPGARLVIAPRHPERFDDVARELEKLGATVHRMSSGDAPRSGKPVVLLDKMGVLGRSFGAADIALVGGAWNPIGGHNLLEPAAHGVPVVHGPHMHAQREIMRIARAHDATIEADEASLADALGQLANSESRRAELGERGREAARQNAGAAHRSVDLILGLIDSAPRHRRA